MADDDRKPPTNDPDLYRPSEDEDEGDLYEPHDDDLSSDLYGLTPEQTAELDRIADEREDTENAGEAGLPLERGERPIVIYTKGDEYIAMKSAIGVLPTLPNLYARGASLVQILGHEPDDRRAIVRDTGAPVISPVGRSHLRTLCSEAAAWHKWDGRSKGHVKCTPPAEVIGALHEAGSWPGVPVVDGVTTVPILRPDGSICDESGHDPVTRYVYRPPYDYPPIPDHPTQEDAATAACTLANLISDFPISNEGGRPAWLALVLSLIARQAFDGPTPLTVIDATTPGTGKTLLADAAAMIATGRVAARTPWSDEDEEMRKRIMSIAMAGDPVVLLDNLPQGQQISTPCLDAALTGTVWRDRVLGVMQMAEFPLLVCWIATGNNVSAVGDTMRRSLRIRLEADSDCPEERETFAIDPLLPHLRKNRPGLVVAALTVLRGYILDGSPKQDIPRYGSFEGWSDLIRSSIVWAGRGDPCAALIAREPDADMAAGAHLRLLVAWAEASAFGGMTARGALELCGGGKEEELSQEKRDHLKEAIEDILPQRGGHLASPLQLATLLRQLRGRWRANGEGVRYRFERGDTAAGGSRRWDVAVQR